MTRRKTARPRGILTARGDDGTSARTRHVRYHPSPDLESSVEHYWSVGWDFRGVEPLRVETLPHPSIHLIFQRDVGARVMGVTRGKFTRLLDGEGSIFAVKFTPAGFHSLLGAPVSSLTDSVSDVREVLGTEGVALAQAVAEADGDASRIEIVERFLRDRLVDDDVAVRLSALVYSAATDRTILKVEDLVERSGMGRRTLERLFEKYVGVSPKWVIQRYRLHEAAEQLGRGDVNQAALATSLGYSDQAHFVRDFKAVVGTSPAAFMRRQS